MNVIPTIFKKVWGYCKKNAVPLVDAALILILIMGITHIIIHTHERTQELITRHIEAVTATQTQTKEVQAGAGKVHHKQAVNDKKIKESVKKAADGVPRDLNALVDMANSVIRDRNSR